MATRTACANKQCHQRTQFILPWVDRKTKKIAEESSFNIHEHRPGVSLPPLAFLILSTLIFDYCRKEILQQKGRISPYQSWISARKCQEITCTSEQMHGVLYTEFSSPDPWYLMQYSPITVRHLLCLEQLAHCVRDHFAHPRKASNC